ALPAAGVDSRVRPGEAAGERTRGRASPTPPGLLPAVGREGASSTRWARTGGVAGSSGVRVRESASGAELVPDAGGRRGGGAATGRGPGAVLVDARAHGRRAFSPVQCARAGRSLGQNGGAGESSL